MAARRNHMAFIVVLLLAGTFTNCRNILKECSHLPTSHTVVPEQQTSPETSMATLVENSSDIQAGPSIQLAFKFID